MKLTKKEQNRLDKELYDAIRKNDLEAVKSAVTAGADVDNYDPYKVPVIFQALTRDTYILNYLLISGANPNIKRDFKKAFQMPLHVAAKLRYEGDVKSKILIDAGADYDIKNSEGDTPFKIALVYRHYNTAELLVFSGYIPVQEDFDEINDTTEKEQVISHFMGLVEKLQNRKTKIKENSAYYDDGIMEF